MSQSGTIPDEERGHRRFPPLSGVSVRLVVRVFDRWPNSSVRHPVARAVRRVPRAHALSALRYWRTLPSRQSVLSCVLEDPLPFRRRLCSSDAKTFNPQWVLAGRNILRKLILCFGSVGSMRQVERAAGCLTASKSSLGCPVSKFLAKADEEVRGTVPQMH